MPQRVEGYHTSGGARIYRLPIHLFPGLWGYAHLVLKDGLAALVDVGSGFGDSNDHLEEGLLAVRREHGEAVDWERLTHVVISHGHIDHFGGLQYVRSHTAAPVTIQGLDRRVLVHYEERLAVAARRLRAFLKEAGVTPDELEALLGLYLLNKHLFSSVEVDFTLESHGMKIGPMDFIHVPGHCPGQVVVLIEDVLLSADHILPDTSPHQAPEQLTLNTGLAHYLESLERIRPLAGQVRVVLGGHEGPMEDLGGRIEEIVGVHEARLQAILELAAEPSTIAEITQALFPETEGYHTLLALEETGAHVEYLTSYGHLGVDNVEDLTQDEALPLRYRRLDENKPPTPIIPRAPATLEAWQA